MGIRIGVDLGGTKIEVIALSSEGDELFRHRLATPQGNYEATLDRICQLVIKAESVCHATATHIGVGIPGAISPASGLIKNANSTCLIGKRLDIDLSSKLQRPVTLANDADCFALSEAVDGSGASYSSVFGVILGTGVGAGIVINKQLLSGPNAICGEWGHNPLPWINTKDSPGRTCYCGKQDCIETFLSGPGFASSYSDQSAKPNTFLSSEQIWQAAREGSAVASGHCDLYIEQLAKSLSSVINILDPACIVLGGGLSNIDEIYEKTAIRLESYVFSDSVNTPIIKAKYGDSSGVRGAAWL
jgi:fructokinase